MHFESIYCWECWVSEIGFMFSAISYGFLFPGEETVLVLVKPGCLSLSIFDIRLDNSLGGCAVRCRMFSSISDLYLLKFSSTHTSVLTTVVPPDFARCLRGKLTNG